MRDLLRREHAVVSEARHRRAGDEGLRVVDAIVDHALRGDTPAAAPAVAEQARAEVAVGELAGLDLVAGVAVAAVRLPARVAVAHAVPVLGDALAFLPVAGERTRIADGRALEALDRLGHVRRRRIAVLGTQALYLVLVAGAQEDGRVAAGEGGDEGDFDEFVELR